MAPENEAKTARICSEVNENVHMVVKSEWRVDSVVKSEWTCGVLVTSEIGDVDYVVKLEWRCDVVQVKSERKCGHCVYIVQLA